MWTPADWAWIGGLVNTLLLAWLHGVPMIAAPRRGFDAEWALNLLAEHGVRNVFLPTTALRMMLQCPIPRGIMLRSLVTGGEPQEVGLLEDARSRFGITFNESYGQTEADFVIGQCASRWPVRPGSMGLPYPGHDVQVLGPDGARTRSEERRVGEGRRSELRRPGGGQNYSRSVSGGHRRPALHRPRRRPRPVPVRCA